MPIGNSVLPMRRRLPSAADCIAASVADRATLPMIASARRSRLQGAST